MKTLLATATLATALLAACAGQPAAPSADPAEVALQATAVAVRAAVAAELGPEPVQDAAPTATPTKTAQCTPEDFQRAKGYRAPGATETLEQTVESRLRNGGKPMGQDGQMTMSRFGTMCKLVASVTYGNELLALTWIWDPRTGHLAAQDALTRFYSGW